MDQQRALRSMTRLELRFQRTRHDFARLPAGARHAEARWHKCMQQLRNSPVGNVVVRKRLFLDSGIPSILRGNSSGQPCLFDQRGGCTLRTCWGPKLKARIESTLCRAPRAPRRRVSGFDGERVNTWQKKARCKQGAGPVPPVACRVTRDYGTERHDLGAARTSQSPCQSPWSPCPKTATLHGVGRRRGLAVLGLQPHDPLLGARRVHVQRAGALLVRRSLARHCQWAVVIGPSSYGRRPHPRVHRSR